ncbi:MAG: hypothetical protein ACXW2Q_06965 [Thermoanaerobaculia bacterium]
MSGRKSEVIVPIRDRRQGRRILTLKNIRNVAVVLIAIFAVITIYAKFRTPKIADDYGRLYKGQIKTPDVTPKQPEIVEEAGPIADADGADPTLLSAAARAQYLGTVSNVPAQTTTVTTASALAPAPAQTTSTLQKDERLTIVGGTEGVSIVKETREPPVLGGGFAKPPQ